MQKETVILKYIKRIDEIKQERTNLFYTNNENGFSIVDSTLYKNLSIHTYSGSNEIIKNFIYELDKFEALVNVPVEFMYKMHIDQLEAIITKANTSLSRLKELAEKIDWTIDD